MGKSVIVANADCCMPIDREENDVDKLQREIDALVAGCEHDFKLVELAALPMSNVDGVFCGGSPSHELSPLKFQCLKCNSLKTGQVKTTCPVCLGSMSAGERVARRQYFGGAVSGYVAELFRCKSTRCTFKVVYSVWNAPEPEK